MLNQIITRISEDGRDIDQPFGKVSVIGSIMRRAEEKYTKGRYFDGSQVTLVAAMAFYQCLLSTVIRWSV